ncbi:MAG: phospholipase D-like domain-containing protein [Acidimicrobiia bacterium]|nr:phospholipase D-like domain-containing protein [Acidimicrobiia bacterium]
MLDFDPSWAADQVGRLMNAVEELGRPLATAKMRKWRGGEHVEHSFGLTRPDDPTGRVGVGVGWTAKMPSGRHIAVQQELVVAVPASTSPEGRDEICGELRPVAEGEVTRALDVMADVTYGGNIKILTDATFYKQLEVDLAGATSSVLVLAPFVGYRIDDVVPWLKAAKERGVAVTVVTRPPTEPWMSKFLAKLTSTDLDVVESTSGMHEKLVVVDKRVVMHGSLNPLSHKDTTETMFRFESSALGATMTTLYDPDAGQTFAERVEARIDDGTRRSTRWAWGSPGEGPPLDWLID